MFSQINTLIYVLMPVFAAALLRPRLQDDRFGLAVIFAFVSIFTMGFLVTNYFLFYGLYILIVLLVANRRAVGLKIPAFLFTLPANMRMTIPFPGLQQLITVGPAEVLGLVAFPTIFKRREKVMRDWVGPLVILFALIGWMLDLRLDGQTFTNWLRTGVEAVIGIIVPYYAVRNAFDDKKNFSAGMKGLLTAIIIVAVVGFWGTYLSWEFFQQMPLSEAVYNSSSVRDGSLRASATLPSTMFSFMSLFGALILWVYRGSSRVQPLFWLWLLVLLLIAPLSASRGGMLGGVIAIGTYFLFCLPSRGLRRTLYAGGALVVLILLGSITGIDASAIDPYGTFAYRQDLIEAAMVKFQRVPFFGDANYATDPFFDYLVQGQGIVDFVNSYIQVGLRYGLAGLLPFLFIIGLSVRNLIKASRLIDYDAFGPDVHAGSLGRAIAGAMVGYSFMIFTVSTVSYILPMVFIFAGIANGYARVARR